MGKHQPALLGGLFIGVLSALPVVGAANVCCCLWVIVGGVLVTYLQQQAKPTPVETGDVVIGGLLAGVIGAVIASLGFLLLTGAGGAAIQDSIRQGMEQGGDVPPEVRDMITRFTEPRTLGVMMFAINIPVYAVFAMAGSLLGMAFFKKKLPPQAPPMPPTFPTTPTV
jgi:hypothetical protein